MKTYLMVGAYPNVFNNSLVKNLREIALFEKYCCLCTSGSPQVGYSDKLFDEIVFLNYSPVDIKTKAFRKVAILLYVVKKYFQLLLTLKKYDVVHIQSLSFYHVVFLPLFWVKSKKLCVTFWGCDFNAASKLKKTYLKFILQFVDSISCTSDFMRYNLIRELELSKDRVKITRFGLSATEYLDKVTKEQIIRFKEKYKIPARNTVVLCAPSGERIRNVFEIIKSIQLIPDQVVSNVTFVFHFGYGEIDYIEELKLKITKEQRARFVVIEEFFNSEEMAVFRKSVDVYINIAQRDQLSGAMLEALYCNNIVIVGEWLNYFELKERAVEIEVIADIDEISLSNAISDCVDKINSRVLIYNANKVIDLIFWNKVVWQWKDFLSN